MNQESTQSSPPVYPNDDDPFAKGQAELLYTMFRKMKEAGGTVVDSKGTHSIPSGVGLLTIKFGEGVYPGI